MKKIKISANAKINLGLQVLNKRDDGYHNINTVFAPVSLHDEIVISESNHLSVRCEPEIDATMENNLAYKAAKYLFESYPSIPNGAEIIIKKHIPTGAGLGGGSSDAASVLLALRKFYNLTYDFKELFNIALKLGSDVPFFLKKGFASASGRGEKLRYFQNKLSCFVLIILPGLHISTPLAYSELNRTERAAEKINFKKTVLNAANDVYLLKNNLFNDFEESAFRQFPVLQTIKQELYEKQAFYAQMSGSGSAMFGLFENEETAESAGRYFVNYPYSICRL